MKPDLPVSLVGDNSKYPILGHIHVIVYCEVFAAQACRLDPICFVVVTAVSPVNNAWDGRQEELTEGDIISQVFIRVVFCFANLYVLLYYLS